MFLEHEYYCTFQRDLRDAVDRYQYMETLRNDQDLRPFLELEKFTIPETLYQTAEHLLLRYGQNFLRGVDQNFEKISAQVEIIS